MTYAYADIIEAYAGLGVGAGRVVYVTSDLSKVMDFEERNGAGILEAHFRALTELLGPSGTIVVPTSTLNLCNTDVPFDPATTPSHMRGALTEHVRKQTGARRSFHPFCSYAALGPAAADITENVSRQAYGPETPEGRMVGLGALALSIGLPPRATCTTVHHVEQVMGVPYRYAKEFIHPVHREGEVRREPFYMNVYYRDMDLERDGNRTLFARLGALMEIREAALGVGRVFSYELDAFYEHATRLFADDIYIWCKTPPEIRPYQT